MGTGDPRERARASRRRSGGFSLVEIATTIGILGFGLLGASALQLKALGASSRGVQHRQAVSIAGDQLEMVELLPWAQLRPTGGFVPPAWINVPGYSRGELPARADRPGRPDAAAFQVYTIQWRVADANPEQTLREIDVQVQWTEPKGRVRSYSASGVRSKATGSPNLVNSPNPFDRPARHASHATAGSRGSADSAG